MEWAHLSLTNGGALPSVTIPRAPGSLTKVCRAGRRYSISARSTESKRRWPSSKTVERCLSLISHVGGDDMNANRPSRDYRNTFQYAAVVTAKGALICAATATPGEEKLLASCVTIPGKFA